MTTQPFPFTPEENVDLRKILDTLLRRWWLIAATVALAAIISVGFSFLFQTTVYESSGSAGLPEAQVDDELGLPPQEYLALASSSPVMDSVREQLDLKLSAGQLRSQFQFSLPQNQTITVTASAELADKAFLLADTWLKSYQRELESLINGQFMQVKAQAVQDADILLAELASAEENLEKYNLENDQSVLESELSTLEARFADTENRLQELMVSTPKNEAILASLQDVLGLESENAGGGGAPSDSQSGEASLELSIPADALPFKSSPAYIELSQDVTRSQLSALERDLVGAENQLRELNLSSIPGSNSRLESLEKALATEPPYLSQTGGRAELTPNPVYLSLSQDLSNTKILLDVQKDEATTLSVKIGALREQIDVLRVELLFRQEIEKTKSTLTNDGKEAEILENIIQELRPEIRTLSARVDKEKAALRKLEINAANISSAYNSANAELDRLAEMEDTLASYSQLTAVHEPAQPSSPVSPQRGRNITLAMFLGLVVGVGGVLLMASYQGQLTSATPARG